MGSSHIHVVHKKPRAPIAEADNALPLEKRADCASGSLYIAPEMGSTIDSLVPLPITWDPTCLPSTPEIDIYLYSPQSSHPRIHVWEKVALSRGTFPADLMPRWWNATASQQLQISIVPAGQPPFMSTFPGGPVFTATYEAPTNGITPSAADTNQIDSGITAVNDLVKPQSSMTPGKTAAAVLLPLLFVGVCVGAYIRMKRNKGQQKRKRFSEAVDKRMSTISTDWKSISAAGANAAIRNSIAVGNRNSSFSFGGIRPTSTYAVEGEEQGQMKQVKTGTGVGLRNPATLTGTGERVSRVSFAPDTRVSRVSFADSRPSGESRRTRAFHSAYIPPVPALPEPTSEKAESDISEEAEGRFSPRQTQGPMTLTPEDIRARIGAKSAKAANNPNGHEFDEVMPALSMMRTGNDPSEPDAFLFSSPPPAPAPALPVPSYPKPLTSAPSSMTRVASPVMSTMPMQPMPASVMSPDEMLRAYAERKKSMGMGKKGLTGASISYPMPAASAATAVPTQTTGGSSNGMRVLYGATGVVSPTNTGDGNGASNNSNEDAYTGYAPSEYSSYTTSVTGSTGAPIDTLYGTATHTTDPYAFGHHPNGSIGVGAYGGAQYAIGEDEGEDVADVGFAGRGAFGAGGAAYAGQHQAFGQQGQEQGQGGYGYAA